MHMTEHHVSLCCCHIHFTEPCKCDEDVSCVDNTTLKCDFHPCPPCKRVLDKFQTISGSKLRLSWAARSLVEPGDVLDYEAVLAATKISQKTGWFNARQHIKGIITETKPSAIYLMNTYKPVNERDSARVKKMEDLLDRLAELAGFVVQKSED